MGKVSRYNIIHQGIYVDYLPPGSWVFIQQPKEYGDKFWYGQVYDTYFYLKFQTPESLADCLADFDGDKRTNIDDANFTLF